MLSSQIDYINFLAKGVPNGAINSDGLEDMVYVYYYKLINEMKSPARYDINYIDEHLLGSACFRATEQLVLDYLHAQRAQKSHLKRLRWRDQAGLPLVDVRQIPARSYSHCGSNQFQQVSSVLLGLHSGHHDLGLEQYQQMDLVPSTKPPSLTGPKYDQGGPQLIVQDQQWAQWASTQDDQQLSDLYQQRGRVPLPSTMLCQFSLRQPVHHSDQVGIKIGKQHQHGGQVPSTLLGQLLPSQPGIQHDHSGLQQGEQYRQGGQVPSTLLGQLPPSPPGLQHDHLHSLAQSGHEHGDPALHRPPHAFQLKPSPRVGHQPPVHGGLQGGVQPQHLPGLVAHLSPVHCGLQGGVQPQQQPGLVSHLSPVHAGSQRGVQPQHLPGLVSHLSPVHAGSHDGVQPLHLPGLVSHFSPVHAGSQGGVQPQHLLGLVSHLSPVHAGSQGGVQPQHMPGLVSHLSPVHEGLRGGVQPQHMPGLVSHLPLPPHQAAPAHPLLKDGVQKQVGRHDVPLQYSQSATAHPSLTGGVQQKVEQHIMALPPHQAAHVHPSLMQSPAQGGHVHGDPILHRPHHALQLPPSPRVGQHLAGKLQPVLGQLPLHPPAPGGHEGCDQVLHRLHSALQMPPSPRVGQHLWGQLQPLVGQLPLQPPFKGVDERGDRPLDRPRHAIQLPPSPRVGQQLRGQLQPVFGQLHLNSLAQSGHEHGDPALYRPPHAFQLPPSPRVGQLLGVQLQPVLGQLPLQPPAQGGHEPCDQALDRPHHALKLPPSPRVCKKLGGQPQVVLGQLPLQPLSKGGGERGDQPKDRPHHAIQLPPSHRVGHQLGGQLQPVLGQLLLQPPAQGGHAHGDQTQLLPGKVFYQPTVLDGLQGCDHLKHLQQCDSGLLVSTQHLVQGVAKIHDKYLQGFKELFFPAIPVPSAFSSSPAPSFSGCFLAFLVVSHHISTEIQLQTHSLSFICLLSLSSKAGLQTASSHLVTIWQGLIVGDGDGVRRPGEEVLKMTARANCLHQFVSACCLAALPKYYGCKKLFFVSCFTSLSQALAGGATPSNFGAASFSLPLTTQ